MADFNKPSGTDLWSTILGQIRSARESVAKMFDGGAGDTNVPTDAKRLDKVDGQFYNYNGSTWDSLGTLGVDPTARADAATAQSTAEAAQTSADDIVELLPSEGLLTIHIGASATGDGSGSDGSNLMAWSTFTSNYAQTTQANNYPRTLRPLKLILNGGTYTTGSEIWMDGLRILYDLNGNVTITDKFVMGNGLFSINNPSGNNNIMTFSGGLVLSQMTATFCEISCSVFQVNQFTNVIIFFGKTLTTTGVVTGSSGNYVTDGSILTTSGPITTPAGSTFKAAYGSTISSGTRSGGTFTAISGSQLVAYAPL